MARDVLTDFQTAVGDLSRRRRYLVGVSGGGDSVALLHLLHESGFQKLIVCHLDHGLRGRASRGDALFVQRLAARLEMPCELERGGVAKYAKDKNLSLETAGREARHHFFARIARGRRCDKIFLGHHADDQAETILFNILRGSGLAGLVGMRSDTELTCGDRTLRVLRPLLGFSRTDLETFLAQRGEEFRLDRSNTDLAHQRNNLRHRILPTLTEKFGRDVRPSLLRLAVLAAAENDLLESLTPDTEPEPSVKALGQLPLALQRRFLARWLREQSIPDLGFEVVERVRALIDPAEIAKVNLPGGAFARRRAGHLFVERSALSTAARPSKNST